MAMSVAETPVTERAPRSPQQQLALGSLLGAAYALAAVWVVLAGLPLLWTEGLQVQHYTNDFLSTALLIVVCLGAAVGLGYLGYALLRDRTLPGLRAGILFGAVLLFLALWLGISVVGQAVENQSFAAAPGWVAVAVVTALLVAGVVALFLQPAWRRVLEVVDDQGWFTAVPYKGNQGVRVRRATVLGVLVLGFAGVITLVSHRSFGREAPQLPANDWYWNIPYTGQDVRVDPFLDVLDRQPANPELQRKAFDILRQQGVKEEAIEKLAANNNDVFAQQVRALLGDVGDLIVRFTRYIPLMYKVHIMMPLLLGLLLLWVAYRVVNLPAFADFLIATEAEMNKVSWTTRRRLFQDTIVVLVTVVLMALFLFVVDALWIKILSWGPIGVLKFDTKEEALKQQEKAQW